MGNERKAQWRTVGFTCLAIVLSLTTWFSATAVLPELSVVWSLTAQQSAWITGAVQAGFIIGALASSALALPDRFSLTRLMAFSALLAAVANSVLLIEPGIHGAIAARFLTGFALAGVYPPSLKFIATWFRSGRGLAMGAMVGALTLGSAAPHLLRATGGAFDWTYIVAATSVCCAISAAIFFMMLREGPCPFTKVSVSLRQFGSVLRSRPVMLANIGYFGHMWELYAMWAWLLAYSIASTETGGFTGNASLLVFAVIAIGGPGSLMAGWLADRIGRCATTSVLMAISGTCAILIGFTFNGPNWAFCVVAILWGLTVVSDSAQFSAAVTELAPQHLVGSALAFQMGIGFAITILTIWIVQHMAVVLGSWQWSLVVLLPGPVVGIVAMMILRKSEASLKLAQGKR